MSEGGGGNDWPCFCIILQLHQEPNLKNLANWRTAWSFQHGIPETAKRPIYIARWVHCGVRQIILGQSLLKTWMWNHCQSNEVRKMAELPACALKVLGDTGYCRLAIVGRSLIHFVTTWMYGRVGVHVDFARMKEWGHQSAGVHLVRHTPIRTTVSLHKLLIKK